jgi:hypothetical protein
MVNAHNASQVAIRQARLEESARVASGIPAEGCYVAAPPAARKIAENHLRSHGLQLAPAEPGGAEQ